MVGGQVCGCGCSERQREEGFRSGTATVPSCRAVRDGSRPCRSRTQSSVAVSADYRRWFLLNASPDVRAQIESFPALHPRGVRDSPLQAVLLTDAELDHTLGLLLLREAGRHRGTRHRGSPRNSLQRHITAPNSRRLRLMSSGGRFPRGYRGIAGRMVCPTGHFKFRRISRRVSGPGRGKRAW